MMLERISMSRGIKVTQDYQSRNYQVGIDVKLSSKDKWEDAYDFACRFLDKMEQKEAELIILRWGKKKDEDKKVIEDKKQEDKKQEDDDW